MMQKNSWIKLDCDEVKEYCKPTAQQVQEAYNDLFQDQNLVVSQKGKRRTHKMLFRSYSLEILPNCSEQDCGNIAQKRCFRQQCKKPVPLNLMPQSLQKNSYITQKNTSHQLSTKNSQKTSMKNSLITSTDKISTNKNFQEKSSIQHQNLMIKQKLILEEQKVKKLQKYQFAYKKQIEYLLQKLKKVEMEKIELMMKLEGQDTGK